LNKEKGRIFLGLTGHYEALRPLIERYGRFAQQVYFPHHHRLGRLPEPGARDCRLRRLMMVFDNDGLDRAASLAMVAHNSSPSVLAFSSQDGKAHPIGHHNTPEPAFLFQSKSKFRIAISRP
jgi:hypothetical protein